MGRTTSFLLLLVIIGSCQNISCTSNDSVDKKALTDTLYYSNITVLLDLSNRIDDSKNPGQINRDTTIMRSILINFLEQVKRNGFVYSKDKIQVLIAPQAGNTSPNFNPYIDVEELANSNQIVREALPQKSEDFMNQIKTIYSTNHKYNGADIWTFFKDNPDATIIKNSYSDEQSVYYRYNNKLVILSDGYLNFDQMTQRLREKDNSCMQVNKLRNNKSWEKEFENYKLRPVGKNLNNLEVMIVELNPIDPQKNTNEIEIIKRYWTQWFKEMNIKTDVSFHDITEPIPIINSSIKSFVQ